MATYLTSAQWRKLEPDLRRVGISPAEYMRQNDIYVDDRMAAKQGTPQPPPIGELPPSPEQGNMAVYGNDTDETEDTAPDTGASDLSARPNVSTLEGILKGQRKSIGDLYDKITENIQQRYRKPDINDLLIAIGTGMMSAPGENDSGGFGGSLQRGLRGIGTYAQNRREYEQDLNKLMSQVEIEKAKTMAGLEEKYLTALKPNTTASYSYATDRGGYVPKPGTGNWPAMPDMDQFGNYVITDQRQITYLPPNTPIVLPGGDPAKPKYTRAGPTR